MKTSIPSFRKHFLSALISFILLSCGNTADKDQILGSYEASNKQKTKTMVYNITHIKENNYGVKFIADHEGKEAETAYYEGTYNQVERILSVNTGLAVMNLQFSDDYEKISLIGDKSGNILYRK
ncbi:MAG: hypothetical protein WBG48_07665 [Pricia sp.]